SSTSPRISRFLKPTSLHSDCSRVRSAFVIAPTRRNRQRGRSIRDEAIDLITASAHLFGLMIPIVVIVIISPFGREGRTSRPSKHRGETAIGPGQELSSRFK